MNYKILDIDMKERTILLEWADGITLNHRIPVEYLRLLTKPNDKIRARPGMQAAMVAFIQKERV